LFSSIDNLSVGKLRAKGYFKALENNNITVNNDFIILTDSVEDFNAKAELFFSKHKIDGIFALDEHASVSAIKLGLKTVIKYLMNYR